MIWWTVFVFLAPIALGGEELSVGPALDLTAPLAEGNQRWPAVAAGPDGYLVVWQEGEAMAGVENIDILCARVGPDGKPRDPKALTVCGAPGLQIYPAAAFDGTNFLVAWQDFRTGKDWDVYAARVSPEGELIDPESFVVASGSGNQIYPAGAGDGKSCWLVWSDLRPQNELPEGYALCGTRVTGGRPAEVNGRLLVPHYDPKTKRLRSYLTPR